MRILYLVNSRQSSFKLFLANPQTGCSWVDAMIAEISRQTGITIGIALPFDEKNYQVGKSKKMAVYGLPNPREKRILKKITQRISYSEENEEVAISALKAISDFKPDIIHVFGTESPLGLVSILQSIPVLIHIQGNTQVVAEKWFAGISKSDILRYSNLSDLLLFRGSYHEYRSFRKKAVRESRIMKSCLYFTGRTTFDSWLVSVMAPQAKYFHCDEYLRMEFFNQRWNHHTKKEISCFSILKGTTYKGVDLLVKTLMILNENTSRRFSFNIAGIGEHEEIVSIIRKKYSKTFNTLNISFLGKMNANELVARMSISDLFIHPSYIENSPNSICEAMAMGMPVISTNVGGINSLITDHLDGLLVQEGEPYSMAAAITELAENPEFAKALGQNARTRSAQRHDPQKITNQILSIYKTIEMEYGKHELPQNINIRTTL